MLRRTITIFATPITVPAGALHSIYLFIRNKRYNDRPSPPPRGAAFLRTNPQPIACAVDLSKRDRGDARRNWVPLQGRPV